MRSAVSVSGTPFSSETYEAASASGSSEGDWRSSASASGSSPFSRAMLARVRRLGR